MKKVITIISVIAIVAVLAVALMACVPSDYNKAESNLKEADYYVACYKEGDPLFKTMTSAFGAENVTAIVTGTSKDLEEGITLVYFKDSKSAKNAFDKFKKQIDDETKEESSDKEYVVKQSGKVIYGGTKKAVKDVQ